MALHLEVTTVRDPDGWHEALLLKGDWLFVKIGDGKHVGLGEASHSRDDAGCAAMIQRLFDEHVCSIPLDLDAIRALEEGPFLTADDLVTATAMSSIDLALHDLVARREGVPVWQLYAERPARTRIPFYVTLNRCLRERTIDEYREVIDEALSRGEGRIKCAPFEGVAGECR